MPKESKSTESKPPNRTESKPPSKKPVPPILSVKTFIQELRGQEAVLGRGFLTYCHVQQREGKKVVSSGTRSELVAEFNKWKSQPVS
jgi:hypothetical protein